MRLDHVSREIICKVVYCGPGLSGKTTNLQYIHQRAPKNAVGKMVSIDTESERTLHFDLLPLDLGTVQGYKCRFEFYTVPGQTYYGATRRMVLEGADGIVFVADSRREMLDENVDALNDLFENLHHHGLPSDLPMVVQYNKQDLPESLSAEQLNPLLNPRGVPWFAASARNGDNILETMKKITTLVIDEVGKKQDLNPDKRGAEPRAAAQSAHDPNQSWILTCHNCQSLLEVPSAKKGDIFTCGSCRAPLEVKDPDKGITRAPATGPVRRSRSAVQAPPEDNTGFAMQSIGEVSPGRSSALSADPSGITQVLPNQPFTLDGYTAVARLDESLLGQRYRVRETSNGRFLRALSLNPQPLRQPGYIQSLEPALSMANQVNHRGVLKLVGLRKQSDQVIILASDAPDHQPLSHVLARRSQLQPPQALRVIQELALALDEAARHGVIHGWLRPDVVLLNAEGAVLIDELGLPKPHAYLLRDSMGASAATEHYLAPEHLVNDSPSDTRTDIFQMGALLFRMLTGEGLVTGYSAHEALHKVSAAGCRSVRSVNPEISREIDAFCSRLTAIERKDRFQSHREVLEGLDRLSHHHRRGATMNLTSPAVRPPARRSSGGTGPINSGTGQIRRSGTGQIRRNGTGTRPLTGSYSRDAAGRPAPAAAPKKSGNGGLVAIVVVLVLGALAVAFFALTKQGQNYLPLGSSPAPQPTQRADAPRGSSPTPTPAPGDPAPVRTDPAPTPASSPAKLIAEAESRVAAYVSNPDPQALTAANDALAAIKDLDPRKWSGLRQALVTAMPVDTPQPVTVTNPSPAPQPAPQDPQATPPEPAPQPAPTEAQQLTPEQIAGLESLISEQRYRDALTQVANLLPDGHQRQGWTAEITRRHADARAALQRAAMKAGSGDEARTLLEPAILLWNMDGDRAWADALIAAAAGREAAPQVDPGAAAAVVLPADGQAPAAEPKESPNGLLLAALRADGKIDEALATGNLGEAERVLKTIDENSLEAAAIRHKLQLWTRRARILADCIAARSPRIRAMPPIAAAPWDVVGAAPEHLVLAEPGGARMNLAWSQVKRAELGSIFGDAAADKVATPVEVALAAVANMVAQQAGPAALATARAAKLQYEGARELQLLLDMFRERQLVALLDAADAAVSSNDPTQLAKVIEELSRGDRLQNPKLAERVEQLKKTLAGLQAGGTAAQPAGAAQPAAGSGKDHLTFDHADDRLAFGERTGAWSVGQGVIANNGDGSLIRTDCGNANVLLVAFTPTKTQGGFTVDFRGVRLVMDLTAQQYLVTSQDERLQPRSFPFVANTQYLVYFTLGADGAMGIQINQADPISIKTGRLSSRLALTTDTGAMITIDEVEVRRGSATPAAGTPLPGIDPAQQQILRDALGFEPLGGAYKDPASPAIVLPRIAGGQSGIAIPLREGMKGAVFTVSGQDAVAVGVGTVDTATGTANGPFYEIPLPIEGDPPLQISITLTPKHFLVQIEQAGAQASTYEVELPAERSHIYLRAALQAQILKTPRILR